MSKAIDQLKAAMSHAMKMRPKVAGFPFLAEVLKRAGVQKNIWHLPSCQSIYLMEQGQVINQGAPLTSGMVDVPAFSRNDLIAALRKDQAGEGTFAEFLESTWKAGVIRYDVDFSARSVSYFGALGEVYVEEYPAWDEKKIPTVAP